MSVSLLNYLPFSETTKLFTLSIRKISSILLLCAVCPIKDDATTYMLLLHSGVCYLQFNSLFFFTSSTSSGRFLFPD